MARHPDDFVTADLFSPATRERVHLALDGAWTGAEELVCPTCGMAARTNYQPVSTDLLARTGALDGRWASLFRFVGFCTDRDCAASHGQLQFLVVWAALQRVTRDEERRIVNLLASSDTLMRCVLDTDSALLNEALPAAWAVKAASTPVGAILEHTIPFAWSPHFGTHGDEQLAMRLWPAIVNLASRYREIGEACA